MSTATATQFRYHTETIRGVEIEKPVPKRLHSIVMRRLMAALLEQTKGTGLEVFPELDMLCGLDRYCPDLTLATADATFTDDMLDQPAFLAVEILSPGQTIGKLFDKCDTYAQHGTEYGWVIWPEREQAWIVTASRIEEAREGVLIAEQENNAFTLKVSLASLFAGF